MEFFYADVAGDDKAFAILVSNKTLCFLRLTVLLKVDNWDNRRPSWRNAS